MQSVSFGHRPSVAPSFNKVAQQPVVQFSGRWTAVADQLGKLLLGRGGEPPLQVGDNSPVRGFTDQDRIDLGVTRIQKESNSFDALLSKIKDSVYYRSQPEYQRLAQYEDELLHTIEGTVKESSGQELVDAVHHYVLALYNLGGYQPKESVINALKAGLAKIEAEKG
jgi:pyruvate/oxaloacetate carboxyltransferase